MDPNWFIWGSPLILLGVPMILFADRNLEHQRQNMRNGKEFVWEEKFRPEIGRLIFHLDDELDLSVRMEDLKNQLKDDDRPNPDGVDEQEDIPTKILNEAPALPELLDVTDAIGEQSKKISKLEEHYQDLEGHLQKSGLSLVVTYGLLSLSQFQLGTPLPDWVYVISLFIILYGAGEGKAYVSKKKELRQNADQYEKYRRI